MNTFWTVLIIILIVVVIALVALYFYGNKLQAQQAEQQALMEQMKQTVSILVIDKKQMKLKEADLPQQAIDSVPWYAKRMKVNVIKAKVGPRIMNLLADAGPYEQLPIKSECKVVVSGIYITQVKSIRGKAVPPIPEQKGIRARISKFLNRG